MLEFGLAILAAPFIMLALLVAMSFLLARAGGASTWLAEYAASAWAFFWLIPFAARWMPSNPATGVDGPPVLLVHGYACNRGVFRSMRARLAAEGYAAYVHDLEPMYADIDTYLPALTARIDAILAQTGRARLAVVCHSMGGLALRAYLREHGGAKIAILVTLGTPHHGTRMAALGVGVNARQMTPGSAWLQTLAPRASHPPVTAIWSTHDNIVAPQESAALEGAQNLPFSGLGHLSLLNARPAVDRVIEVLRSGMPL